MRPVIDKITGVISRNGTNIGVADYKNSIGKIYIHIEANVDEAYFAENIETFMGVVEFMFPDTRPASDYIEIMMEINEIERTYDVQPSLNEKQIKQKGYVWRFHKNDPDTWPSDLHGHDYDLGLKIDAITGAIYDVITKKHCFDVKNKYLKDIQKKLRDSSDFSAKAIRLLGSEEKPDPCA